MHSSSPKFSEISIKNCRFLLYRAQVTPFDSNKVHTDGQKTPIPIAKNNFETVQINYFYNC